MPREVEVLYALKSDAPRASELYSKLEGFSFRGVRETEDTYYHNPTTGAYSPDDNLRLTSSLRIRRQGNLSFLTAKSDHFDERGRWVYSDEDETSVGDPAVMSRILAAQGFTELVVIKSRKHVFTSSAYEAVLEEVDGLGTFVEVEAHNKEIPESRVQAEKDTIIALLQRMGLPITEELNMGKPELMLRKLRGVNPVGPARR